MEEVGSSIPIFLLMYIYNYMRGLTNHLVKPSIIFVAGNVHL